MNADVNVENISNSNIGNNSGNFEIRNNMTNISRTKNAWL